MLMREGSRSLRGLIIEAWEQVGRPPWSLAQTVEVAESADDLLTSEGAERAATFHARRLAGDRQYVRQWVAGSRLEWLKPGFAGGSTSAKDAVGAGVAVERQLAQTLNNEQREAALKILNQVRSDIRVVANGDSDVAFHVRRFIHARLQLDGRPPRALQRRKFDDQQGRCGECVEAFTKITGTHLHRLGPGGYSAENTVLLHPQCHTELHRRQGTPPDED